MKLNERFKKLCSPMWKHQLCLIVFIKPTDFMCLFVIYKIFSAEDSNENEDISVNSYKDKYW